jgi:two-component system, cell cycle sensor histidine kinase and response regulator CckA
MKSDLAFFPLETAGWPALLVDQAITIYRANQMAVNVLGISLEGTSPPLSSVWAPENQVPADQFPAHWERAPVPTTTLKFKTRNGATLEYQACVSTVFKENQRLLLFQLFPPGGEAALAQKQKLDCALQMARTVALDFNNALTTVLGHSSHLLNQLAQAEPNHPWRTALLEIEKAAGRAAEVADDLGTFSRQDKENRNAAPAANLNLLLHRVVESLKQAARPNQVNWAVDLERQLYTAKFDEGKLQQAILKILDNAIESLPGDGRITVQTRNYEAAEPLQDGSARINPGTYVCVEIMDTGCGIEPAILPRIFEPFFTTKQGGNHRGLGLALVYGIVSNHGGTVAVTSQPGAGTAVRLYLPAERKFTQDQLVSGSQLSGTETVLMVDDEESLLTMGQSILSSYGYSVFTASSGKKGLEILARRDPVIDLVITDLVMPGMSGRELVEHIRAISPITRVIRSTGYVWPGAQNETDPVLQKPYSSQQLLSRVRQALAK